MPLGWVDYTSRESLEAMTTHIRTAASVVRELFAWPFSYVSPFFGQLAEEIREQTDADDHAGWPDEQRSSASRHRAEIPVPPSARGDRLRRTVCAGARRG